MANIEDDTGLTRKIIFFKSVVAYLLHKEPVVKRSTTNKRGVTDILNMAAEVSSFGTKADIGKKGVHLRYHKPK